MILTPGEEAPHDAGVGAAGVVIGDPGSEEFIGGKEGIGAGALEDSRDRSGGTRGLGSGQKSGLGRGWVHGDLGNDNYLYRVYKTLFNRADIDEECHNTLGATEAWPVKIPGYSGSPDLGKTRHKSNTDFFFGRSYLEISVFPQLARPAVSETKIWAVAVSGNAVCAAKLKDFGGI